jgi:NTE family protein
MSKKALYFAGGGARGAYQVGVLKAIAHIIEPKKIPVEILSSVSVGTINAVMLASHADDFPLAVKKLEKLWGNLHCSDIYKANNLAMLKSVMRNMAFLIFKQIKSSYLLDSEPLQNLIKTNGDFKSIARHVDDKTLEIFEVIANCYDEHKTYSFYDTALEEVNEWKHPRHACHKTIIEAEHIMASSALPLFFPAIKLKDGFFGDGSMRLISPLRGCVHFKAEKILVLGTRQKADIIAKDTIPDGVGFSQILGNMLNAIFIDNLDRDIELIDRMNTVARLLSRWKKRRSPWRPIDILYLRPKIDIAQTAKNHHKSLPFVLRYLLNFLGARNKAGDLLSFLLFEKAFCSELIELGYTETLSFEQELIDFFKD